MRKNGFIKSITCAGLSLSLLLASVSGKGLSAHNDVLSPEEEVIKLRVSNWEEYIDLGDWDEEEAIELDNGMTIMGENPMVEDFETWYYETYGVKVLVEYSCFGTNEDLYNQLTLGDAYDLICPSDYLIMKLMAEDELVPLSEDFFDTSIEENYYAKGVSPYIKKTFDENEINGESWSKYAAGYMWGITGILYNPEEMSYEEAATWSVFANPKFERRITIKDNVRDSYFAAVGAVKADILLSEDFINSPDYHEKLTAEMNDVSTETVLAAQELLQDVKDNAYAFETDSGKADIVSGKIAANYQWSGDAVYAMDLAEEDDVYLEFAVPKESTNLWFDGWIMLKDGINGDAKKQHAAEAFINFLSRPDNAVRNMYYIGYTSVISGGTEDTTVFDYLNYCYATEDESDIIEYPVGYFFSGESEDEDYIVYTDSSQVNRQLYSQYPSEEVIKRSSIMEYFDDEASKRINQMWINVRCYNLKDVPLLIWIFVAVCILGLIVISIVRKRRWKIN